MFIQDHGLVSDAGGFSSFSPFAGGILPVRAVENFWTFFPHDSSCVEFPLKTRRPFPGLRVEQAMFFLLGGEVLRDIFFKLLQVRSSNCVSAVSAMTSSSSSLSYLRITLENSLPQHQSRDTTFVIIPPHPNTTHIVRVACYIVHHHNTVVCKNAPLCR